MFYEFYDNEIQIYVVDQILNFHHCSFMFWNGIPCRIFDVYIMPIQLPPRANENPSEPRVIRATRGKARTGRRNQPTTNDIEESDFDDDDEETLSMTLCAKDRKFGYMSKKGFTPYTNFLVDIESQVSSDRYMIKGIK